MNYYLERFSVRPCLIIDRAVADLGIVVVIPCHNEQSLLASLQSLYRCDRPIGSVEIIVVVNASESASEAILKQNEQTVSQAEKWIHKNQNDRFKFHLLEENQLPKKHAGVGLARKIGMDEAVRRFESIHHSNGIILCFDADATCDSNYLVEVERHFKQHPKSPACSIHFEHPIAGDHFSVENYNGILQYELHLRYYKNGLRFCGFPFAFHTIGSSMAVRCDAYQKQNGMNKRKAGEDFYFLQKLIPLGNFTELKTTRVIPSPRVSDRVPFGTGKAMEQWLDQDKQELLSYNTQSLIDLKLFVDVVPNLFDTNVEIPESVQSFLATINFSENLLKIRSNSTSEEHFVKLFYNWFNAFKVLKYMHFARDSYYPDTTVFESANGLLGLLKKSQELSVEGLLTVYRAIDKS